MNAVGFLPPAAVAVKWLARLVSLLLLVVVAMFVIGEGPPPLTGHSAASFAILAGLLLGLFWDGVGAAVIVAGLAAFYLLNYWASGRWPGGAFPLFLLPAALLLTSFALARTRRTAPP